MCSFVTRDMYKPMFYTGTRPLEPDIGYSQHAVCCSEHQRSNKANIKNVPIIDFCRTLWDMYVLQLVRSVNANKKGAFHLCSVSANNKGTF